MESFVALFDAHVGSELKGGHKMTLHDPKAVSVAMQFVADFKPRHVVLGGDMLDCGAVGHHNKGKAGKLEGLRILGDAKTLRELVLTPLEQIVKGRLVYHVGNHEDWLSDLVDEIPGLDGIVDVKSILSLGRRWEVIPQGETSTLGKMVFAHGDQIKGGQNPAKWAVDAYNRNIFFGHHHTHQAFTKVSALDLNGHTGTAVPCLCRKNPQYGEGSPNRWIQGFLYGWFDSKIFNAYVAVIINGQCIANGKAYQG